MNPNMIPIKSKAKPRPVLEDHRQVFEALRLKFGWFPRSVLCKWPLLAYLTEWLLNFSELLGGSLAASVLQLWNCMGPLTLRLHADLWNLGYLLFFRPLSFRLKISRAGWAYRVLEQRQISGSLLGFKDIF